VVEVSDATLDTDRGRKLAGYATAGVPIYWIVNLIDRQVEVYTKPIPGLGQYAAQTNYQVGQRVPIVIQNRRRIGTIEVDLIMPPVAGS
jgi:Uma2 family endonuclease